MEQRQWHPASRKASNITMLRSKELLTQSPWSAECILAISKPHCNFLAKKAPHLARASSFVDAAEEWKGYWNPEVYIHLFGETHGHEIPETPAPSCSGSTQIWSCLLLCCFPASTGCLLLHKRSSAPRFTAQNPIQTLCRSTTQRNCGRWGESSHLMSTT